MARLALILLSVSLAFSGCSCDDDDPPAPQTDGGQDSGMPDSSMTDSSTTDSAVVDSATDSSSNDEDAGYDAGPGPRNACGGEMCDLLSATSCEMAGEGCVYLLDESSPVPFAQCEPLGTVAEGAACNSAYDCAPGLSCTGDVYRICRNQAGTIYGDYCEDNTDCTGGLTCIQEGAPGVCRQHCCNLNQKSGCPGEQACVVEFLDGNDEPTGVGLCNACDSCNPLDSAGTCNGNAGCYPIPGNDGRTFTDCTLCLASTQNLAAGALCRSVNDCAPGLGCFRLNNRAPVCVEMCDLSAATDPCPGAATCQDRLGAASLEGEVGACIE